MSKKEKLSLRKAFHTLGNRYHLTVLIPGFIRKLLERVLQEETLSDKGKENIGRAITDLGNLESTGKDANELIKNIKSIAYEKLNPDEVFIEGASND